MARRFIVSSNNIKELENEKICIYGEEVKHIQVLRFNVGDYIHVNDSIYKIDSMSRDTIELEFVEKAKVIGVPNTNITLYMAFLKSDKMDFVVQKAVELGVSKIVPFFSSNVIVKLDEKDRLKRQTKLQKIADEACKQCGRTDTVEVATFVNFKDLEKEFILEDKVFFAYEASKESLRVEINEAKEKDLKKIGVVIGAEGGFTPKEADELKEIENVAVVGLGERILRAETAALNLISIIIYEMEE
ncbi:MAG: 16S rRNA (uracil(1498)-N(3))-methyltransferase [Clostridia bacterium]|nr:16S rRNA (uracil(1498)-N(3))-methyltransferase [Clostridia bacterium]